MHPWPFDTITPEQVAKLTEAEQQLLEAVVVAYLAEISRQRHTGTRPAPG